MPAVRLHVPKYCLLKARGLAYVCDRGRVRYLGKYGSPESKEAYGRFLDNIKRAIKTAYDRNSDARAVKRAGGAGQRRST